MKKIIVALVIMMTFAFVSHSSAQAHLGVGLTYASKSEKAGLNIRGGYDFAETYGGQVGFNYYFADKGISLYDINVNARYYLLFNDSKLKIYPFAGLYAGFSTVEVAGVKSSSNSIGLNLGAGGQYSFTDQLFAFLDAKYVISETKQFVPTLGVGFSL